MLHLSYIYITVKKSTSSRYKNTNIVFLEFQDVGLDLKLTCNRKDLIDMKKLKSHSLQEGKPFSYPKKP